MTLAALPDRFQSEKEQGTMADRAWIERDAVTGAPSANWINGAPASPSICRRGQHQFSNLHPKRFAFLVHFKIKRMNLV